MTKLAVITGASAGIGAEFANQLHASGYNLLLIARREEILGKMCEAFNSRRPNSTTYLRIDLSKRSELLALAERLKGEDIELLVNNVGRGSFGMFDNLSLDGEIDMVELNVIAPLAIAHAVIPGMKNRRRGKIIYVSSIAAFQPLPYMATYSATKSFNFNHALGLRAELAKFGISVLALCPGPTATEFGGVARVPGTLTGGPRDSVELVVRKALSGIQSDLLGYSVPGIRSLLISLSSRIIPFCFTTRIAERILGKALNR